MSAVAPFSAPFDEHDDVRLFTALSSTSHTIALPHSASPHSTRPSPSASVSASQLSTLWLLPFKMVRVAFLEFLSQPPYGHRRAAFRRYTTPRYLRRLFAFQLAFHLFLLAASIPLVVLRGAIVQLLSEEDVFYPAFGVLEQLPAWLLARSAVSVALSARRLWLGNRWQSSMWEAAWCVLVMWLSTGVMAGSSLVALGGVQASESAMYFALWAVVSVLLVALGSHIAACGSLALFFPATALTFNMPVLPLAQHWYDDAPNSSPPKRRQHEGLTRVQLQALPVSACTVKRADSCCAVCMDDVELGQVQRVLRCGHAYHQTCIDPWLLRKRVCPLCAQVVRVASRSTTLSEPSVELADVAKPAEEVDNV